MKRNWKTLQQVLEWVERDELEAQLQIITSVMTPEEEAVIYGHLELAVEAGLVAGFEFLPCNGNTWRYRSSRPRLTMQGHDVLESIRSKTVWEAIKRTAIDKAVPVTLELIKSVAINLARS